MGREGTDRSSAHIVNDFRGKVFHTGERHSRHLVFCGVGQPPPGPLAG